MSLEKLKEARESNGLTFQQVADQVGLTKQGYWMIENGKRGLSYPMAVKIADVFDMKPDDIFLDSELTKTELKEVAK